MDTINGRLVPQGKQKAGRTTALAVKDDDVAARPNSSLELEDDPAREAAAVQVMGHVCIVTAEKRIAEEFVR
jgi:hypothetical protein